MPAQDSTLIMSGPATFAIVAWVTGGGAVAADIGFTRDGVTITKTRATRDIEADQQLHPVDTVVTAESFEIAVKILQSTYANLALLWDEPGAGKLGMSAGSTNRFKIEVYGTRRDGKQVKWTFYKVTPTTFGAYAFSKAGESLIEVTFKANWDDSMHCIGLFAPATEA